VHDPGIFASGRGGKHGITLEEELELLDELLLEELLLEELDELDELLLLLLLDDELDDDDDDDVTMTEISKDPHSPPNTMGLSGV
jgi:hypothetical protein